MREPLHPLVREDRQLAAELFAVEEDLRRLFEHHRARRGVAHGLPDRHEPMALENRSPARLERLADRVGELLRAGHEPGNGPGVGQEDGVGVDGREALAGDAEGGRDGGVRVHGGGRVGPDFVGRPVHLVLDRGLVRARDRGPVLANANEVVLGETALVHLTRGDPDERGVGCPGADVAAGRREEPHREELVRDLDDLLPGVLIGVHSLSPVRYEPPPRRRT